MLSNKEIIERVQGYFSPLRCVAEIWDYDTKLRFKVFDKNDIGVYENQSINLSAVREETGLNEILDAAKESLKKRGYRLG